jgi:hypothetical protein
MALVNKLHNIKPTLAFWPSSLQENRHCEVVLSRLRIGHTYLTHSHLLNRTDAPKCGVCDVPLTVQHILVECTNYQRMRQLCFPNLSNITPTSRLSYILSEGDNLNLVAILRFLHHCHLEDLI